MFVYVSPPLWSLMHQSFERKRKERANADPKSK